tara:strand:+ start:7421 stop:8266 length:846 start_codon:yes stop_codon:yes gene_type:complete
VGHLGTFVWLMLLASGVSAASIDPYPGSKLIGSTGSDDVVIHRLITGEVKRSNGQVTPESSDFVRGVRSTQTYEVPEVGRKGVTGKFFKEQIQSLGQLLFECVGRDCGSSNYWANVVFDQALLYGPTEDQHYLLGKLSGDRGDYVIVYLAQRATGKRYIHIETISDVAGESLLDSRLVASALRLQHRFVIESELDENILIAVKDALNEGTWPSLALVAHDQLLPTETLEAAQARTQERARAAKSKLEAIGADTKNLVAIGAGPISPIDRSNIKRLELILLR